jgi:hypothetical protein
MLKSGLLVLWVVVLITGNFWIYPDKIAQGWDATLAHLPYYELQKQAIDYLDNNNIELDKVETFFPSHGTIDAFQLNNDNRIIDGYEGRREYVIYSNINNIADKEYDLLHSRDFEIVKVGLEAPRDELYARINDRVDTMIHQGLIEEAKHLTEFKELPSLKTVGYQELFPYFNTEYSLEEAIRLIKRNSRRFAKRQMTWYRKDSSVKWYSYKTSHTTIVQLVEESFMES